MTNPTRKRVVTLDDLNVLNQNAAYARQKGEEASAAAQQADTARQNLEELGGDTQAAGQQATQAAQAATLAKNSATAAALQASQAAGDAVTAAELAEGAAGTANQAAGAATTAAQRVTDAVLDLTDIKVDLAQSGARADAAVNTLSKSTSLGVLRADKTALDAAFAAAPVGATGTDNATGDVYLKTQGATDWGAMITNLSSGAVSVRRFGARPTAAAADNLAALNAAAAFSASSGQKIVVNEALTISAPWIIPANVQVTFTRRGVIKPNGAFTAIIFRGINTSGNVRVDTRSVPGYNTISVEVDGSAAYQAYKDLDISIETFGPRYGFDQGAPATPVPGSIGVALRSNQYFVSLCSFPRIISLGYETPLLLHANEWPGYTTGFVNGNNFGFVLTDYGVWNIDLRADAASGEVAGNKFPSYQLQARSFSLRGIRAATLDVSGNEFSGESWDFYPPDGIVHETLQGNYGNRINDSHLTANSLAISSMDTATTNNRSTHPQMWFAAVPGHRNTRSFLGNQDDILAYANDRWGLSQTSGPTVTGGGLARAFLPDPGLSATWAPNPATPIVITLNTNAFKPLVDMIGLQFDYNQIPKAIKIEVMTGGTWGTVLETNANTRDEVIWQENSNQGRALEQLRMTFSAAPNGINLVRVWARGLQYPGQAFLTRGGESSMLGPLIQRGYNKSGLPAASFWTKGICYVNDPAAGKSPLVYSDGTSWRYVMDNTVV